MKINNKMTLLAMSLSIAFTAQALELNSGITSRGRDTIMSDEQRQAVILSDNIILKELAGKREISKGVTNFGYGDVWYWLLNDLTVHSTDNTNNEYLGSWPLGDNSNCTEVEYHHCYGPFDAGRWGEDEFIEPEIEKRHSEIIPFPFHFTTEYNRNKTKSIGCLEYTPLRFGDVDNDKQNELIVFLKDTWLIFSPEMKKTTFATMYNYPDFISWQALLDKGFLLRPHNETTPQFGAHLGILRGVDIGYRAYSKAYFDDFDDDGKFDIVLWRKFYQSNLYGQDEGFELVRDTYLHYEKEDGEYKLQETSLSIVIEDWLINKELTWQSGFPSKSECEAQEGQLIPEMHDPLLNDPDVLK